MINFNQKFNSRVEINELLGGDIVKGIVPAEKSGTILLFTNQNEIYTDYFYPKSTYEFCMYTGIGRYGNQDSVENSMYNLNIAVMTHKRDRRPLLLFEKRQTLYYFIGEYELMETHQNLQPDHNNTMRRVFVFHLKKVCSHFSK